MMAVVGDICLPKTEAIIIPDDGVGTMRTIIFPRVGQVALGGITKESKEFLKNNKIEVGDCFITGPGRLKKRGVQKVYHVVIKRLQSDFTSIYYVEKGLDNALRKAVKDKIENIAICGFGIEPGELDPISVAVVFFNTCSKYNHLMKIKIIDTNTFFIDEINRRIKGTIYETS